MLSSRAGWLLLVVTDEDTAATRTRAESGPNLGTCVEARAGLPVEIGTTGREYLRAQGWLRRPTPPPVVRPDGAASLQLIFRRRAGSPWSWHQFGRVGPDGCPGFKGPFPQPVSMSGAKFRCDSRLAQGTAAQSRRSPREGKEHDPRAPSGVPGPEAPRKTRKPSLGLRRGVHAAHGFRSASGPETPPARMASPSWLRAAPFRGCAARSNVLTC